MSFLQKNWLFDNRQSIRIGGVSSALDTWYMNKIQIVEMRMP